MRRHDPTTRAGGQAKERATGLLSRLTPPPGSGAAPGLRSGPGGSVGDAACYGRGVQKIGYLIPEFPGQTHIFFWRELQALPGKGVSPELVSTRPPPAR